MLDRLYTRLLAFSQHPKALWVLALVAFAESSVFPIPPDVLILPMVLAAPSRAWIIALVAMHLGTFIATSVMARGLRFFLLAFLVWKFGTPIRTFIERRLGLLSTLFMLFLIGGFFMVQRL